MKCGRCGQEATGLYPKWVISGWNGKIYEPYFYWAHTSQVTGSNGKRKTQIKWHYMGKWEKYYKYYKEAEEENKKYERTHKEEKKQYTKNLNNMTVDEAFRLIGITQNSTPEQAKKAFRDAVFKFHPDREPNEALRFQANENMKQINRAWEIIGEHYKRMGH